MPRPTICGTIKEGYFKLKSSGPEYLQLPKKWRPRAARHQPTSGPPTSHTAGGQGRGSERPTCCQLWVCCCPQPSLPTMPGPPLHLCPPLTRGSGGSAHPLFHRPIIICHQWCLIKSKQRVETQTATLCSLLLVFL